MSIHDVFARTDLFSHPRMVLALLSILILSLTVIMLRNHLLRLVVRLVVTRPFWVLGGAAVITLASLTTLPFITVSTSRAGLLDEDNPYKKQCDAFLREFGNPNHLIAVVEGGTIDQRRTVSDELARALRAERTFFKSVFHKVDLDQMKRQGLLYVPLKELEALHDALGRQDRVARDLMRRFLEIDGLIKLIKTLEELAREGMAKPDPMIMKLERQGIGLDIFEQFFVEMEDWLKNPRRTEIKALKKLYLKRFDPAKANLDPQGYLADRGYKRLYQFIRPVTDSDETRDLLPMVERARSLANAVAAKHPGVKVQFTGYPALQVDEMTVIQRDMFITTMLALVGIAFVFMLVFRVVRQAILANVALLIGLLWSVAFTIVVYGGFNLITSLFAAVLLGLGIDFGIHVIARFNEARGMGATPAEAVEQSVLGVGPGLVTGALTTSAAFYTIAISDFRAFAELGVIAGTGMLFMLLAALTILPSMLLIKPGPVPELAKPSTGKKRAAVVRLLIRWPVAILVVGGVITAAASLQKEPPLDYNVASMMPEDTESRDAYTKMIQESNFKSDFVGIVVKSVKEARVLEKELKALGIVSRVEHGGNVIPEHQDEKLKIIKKFRELFEDWRKNPYRHLPAVDPLKLEEALDDLEGTFDEASVQAKHHGMANLAKGLDPVRRQIRRIQRLLVDEKSDPKVPRPGAKQRAEAFQKALFTLLGNAIGMAFEMLNPKRITKDTLPLYAKERFFSKRKNGGLAVYVYPDRSIYNRVFLGEFVKATRKAAAKVKSAPTGFPVTFYQHVTMIREGLITAGFLAGLAIMLLLMLDFTEDKWSVLALVPLSVLAVWSYQMAGWIGALGFVLVMVGGMAMFDIRAVGFMVLALVPLVMGAAWMVGMMSLFNIDYTLANVVSIPLLMGIGVVYCVHIIHRFRQEKEQDVFAAVRHTGGAVFLAALTTMIGFGSLSAGSHGGMKSMGLTMLIGIFTCMVCALVILPAMLRLLPRVRKAEAEAAKNTSQEQPRREPAEDEAPPPADKPGDSEREE